jgi:hypothetical protein
MEAIDDLSPRKFVECANLRGELEMRVSLRMEGTLAFLREEIAKMQRLVQVQVELRRTCSTTSACPLRSRLAHGENERRATHVLLSTPPAATPSSSTSIEPRHLRSPHGNDGLAARVPTRRRLIHLPRLRQRKHLIDDGMELPRVNERADLA